LGSLIYVLNEWNGMEWNGMRERYGMKWNGGMAECADRKRYETNPL